MHNGAIMPTDVRCQVVSREPYPVACLVGTLDGHSMAAARDALLECLADQPEAVVVDVSRLTVADPEALSIFTVVAEQAAGWPARARPGRGGRARRGGPGGGHQG
jgi:hypothetical protein